MINNDLQTRVLGSRAQVAAAESGGMSELNFIALQANQLANKGMSRFAAVISSGWLPQLKKVNVDEKFERHPPLRVACLGRDIEIA